MDWDCSWIMVWLIDCILSMQDLNGSIFGIIGSGNCEHFCFSYSLNVFTFQFQPSCIQALQKFFRQEGHHNTPPPPKSDDDCMPMFTIIIISIPDTIKVAQNSFQHIARLRFWCVILSTLYQLMLQSWFRKFKVALNPKYRIYLNFAKSYISSCLSKFTVLFLKYKCLKLKLRVFLAGHSVIMTTYCVTKLIPTCSPVIGQFFDIKIVASIDKEW